MPRGKNYVNQHKGMALKAASKEAVKELCFYGSACQRKDCIYRHDKNSTSSSTTVKSSDPCMAYLSGFCSFTAKTCRKRHPTSDAEVEALLRKYAAVPCRFGLNCKTNGCLYLHPDSDASNTTAPAYPPLNLPQPYGPPLAARRPTNNSKAVRRTLMDPNAFPPLGAETPTTTEENPAVCLPAVIMDVTPPPNVYTHTVPPLRYPVYSPNIHGPMSPPPSSSFSSSSVMMTTPESVPNAPPLESSTSSASWNLKAQEFVPRGLI